MSDICQTKKGNLIPFNAVGFDRKIRLLILPTGYRSPNCCHVTVHHMITPQFLDLVKKKRNLLIFIISIIIIILLH